MNVLKKKNKSGRSTLATIKSIDVLFSFFKLEKKWSPIVSSELHFCFFSFALFCSQDNFSQNRKKPNQTGHAHGCHSGIRISMTHPSCSECISFTEWLDPDEAFLFWSGFLVLMTQGCSKRGYWPVLTFVPTISRRALSHTDRKLIKPVKHRLWQEIMRRSQRRLGRGISRSPALHVPIWLP